jgi:hypothetical protein
MAGDPRHCPFGRIDVMAMRTPARPNCALQCVVANSRLSTICIIADKLLLIGQLQAGINLWQSFFLGLVAQWHGGSI